MLDSFLVYLGFVLTLAGLVSLIRPIRFLYIRTRLAAAMVIAAGACLEFVAGDMLDSFLVYLGLTLFLAGLVSLLWPLRFLEIRTRRIAAMVAAGGLLLFLLALPLPVSENTVTASFILGAISSAECGCARSSSARKDRSNTPETR
jgi:hypothetical protein